MKILEICTSKSLGGLELYFLNCCRNLAAVDDNIVIPLLLRNSQIATKLNVGNSAIYYSNDSWLARYSKLHSAVKEIEPDIVHSHIKTDLFIIALVKILSRKKFMHVHTRQMNMPRKKKSLFHRFIYGQVDLLIAITQKLREQVLQNTTMAPESVKVLYYGVPEKKEQTTQFAVLDRHFKIGVFARIDKKKNQHVLLEALRILKAKKTYVSAYLIGKRIDTQYFEMLEEIISKHELKDQVHFPGFIEDPISIMANFDVILLTSEEETFGLVLAEAMRAGVAVIGANSGGVPEIIKHERTGLLFRPKDPESLAFEIEKLIKDKTLLERLASEGKKFADMKFREDVHFRSLTILFRQLVNS